MKNEIYSFLKNYFRASGANSTHTGDYLAVFWPDMVEQGGFTKRWSVDLSNGVDLQYHLFTSRPEEVKQIWNESAGKYYQGEITMKNPQTGQIILSMEIDPFKLSASEMDRDISRMTEAIVSLVSRLSSSQLPCASYLDNECRTMFLRSNFRSFSEKARFEEMELFEDVDFPLEGSDHGDEEDIDLSSIFTQGPKLNLDFKKPAPKTVRTGFRTIAGMDYLKEDLGERVIWPLNNKTQAKKYRVEMPSGMLLYGPPGCGKTYFAEKFAEETGMSYVLVKPSDLANIYLHGSQNLISELFAQAEKNSPCVVCFDEFDALVPKRDSSQSENRNCEVNEFLTQMNDAGKKGIFIIGTTNLKDSIDPAILRSGRLDIQVEIKAPDAPMRESLFRYHLSERPLDSSLDTETLAGMTEGYASSDIVAIVNKAALKAAIANVKINQKHLVDAISKTKSSLEKAAERRTVGFKPAKSPCALGA